jgi:hypothetical protein
MPKNCHSCKKEIDIKKEKYVLLGTYNGTGKAKDNEIFFHFNCWIDYFNAQILRRIQKGQDMALGMLKGALNNMNVKIQNG